MNIPAVSSREQFDRQAAHYNEQWNTWSAETLQRMLELAACRPEEEAIDAATGTGFAALAFAPHLKSVLGLDVSEGMLQEARKRAEAQGITNVTFQTGEAENLPLEAASYPLVLCRIAAHHFLSVPKFLKEVHRVLAPGGRLVLTDTAVPEDPLLDEWQNHVEKLRDHSHNRNYSLEEWKSMVEEAGLSVATAELRKDSIQLTLNAWLEKAGCRGEAADTVRTLFREASPQIREAFSIHPLEENDRSFTWFRIALKAIK